MRKKGISLDFFLLINSSLNVAYVPVIIVIHGVDLALLERPVRQTMWCLQMLSDLSLSHGGRGHKDCDEGPKNTCV
jgi:hypothetical protein